jgi:predicted GH43/DUF377 family glycosyl hydrolase
VPWTAPRELLSPEGQWAELDAAGASLPAALEDGDGTVRLWYTGSDGSTSRVLAARCAPGGTWERLGVAIDAGFAGDSDEFGVDAPCVVRTPRGYLMAYAGSDGADTRLHMATSVDGDHWEAHGTFMQRGEADAVGATHPCLVLSDRWWLFYAGYDGADNGRHGCILAAVSANGASWDRVGTVLEPEPGELAVREPWVLASPGAFTMFYVSDDDKRTIIELATSIDALSWSRRGTTIGPAYETGRGVRSPCAVHSRDGRVRLWYAGPSSPSPIAPDRLWLVEAERFAL